MDNRYKIVISSRTLYKEIELSPSAKQMKIGTGMDCDVRLHKSLFFGKIELLFTKTNGEWSLLCSDNLYITVGDIRKMVTKKLHNGDALEIKYFDSDNTVFNIDFLIDFDDGHIRYERIIDTSYQPEIRIGCSRDNTIVIDSPYVNNDSIILSRYGENYKLNIIRSSYGVLHNGKQAESGELVKNGDFISVSDFFFCLKDGRIWTQIRTGIDVQGVRFTDKPERNGYPKFIRNTRVKTIVNDEKIEILDPPAAPEKPKNDIFSRLLPAVGMLAVAGYMATKGGAMIIMSLMSTGMSIVTGVMAFISGKKEYREKTAERIESYNNYIERKRDDISELRNQEQEQLSELYVSQPEEIERFEQFSPSLFDRRKEDDDFLCVRLGTGQVKAKREINYKKKEKLEIEDELQVMPAQVCESFRYINNAPIVCPLRDTNAIGIVGREAFRYDFLKNIVVDIAARHYESDVKMAFVAEPENKERVYPFRFLPQVQCEAIGSRLIVTNGDSKNTVFEFLYKELTQRKQNKYVGERIVVFLYDEFGFQNHPLSKFVDEAAKLGITFLFFAENTTQIPMGCSYIVDIKDAQNAVLISTKDKNDATEFEYPRISEQEVQDIIDIMAPVYTEELSLEGSLTKSYSMFEMLNIIAVDDLDIESRWASTNVTKSMAAPLGISKSNMIYLDLHDKAHGPHGLVAGTTGSGKSEILQTYILAMATLYHPYEVGFVIIDFKGGGMVNQFRKLPHLVGAITNIDGKEINRSLKSIKAELQKRQRLFAEADVNHIDKYIGKYKKGEVSIPLPHLIIIVDEFAELKAEQPEFMKELISAARIGRSLGVHLILATQKPSGQVNEQIWSNSRFKLCLKVQTPEDSNEMLKSPLAAEIKEPGRAYLQVGNNEIFELFQSAYSGAPERTDGANVKAFSIFSLDESGKRTPVYVQKKSKASSDSTTQLDAIVHYVESYCQSSNIAKLPDICLPSLPSVIKLPPLKKSDSLQTAVDFGMFDDPDNQLQGTYKLDLSLGNVVIIGSSQTGKTNALQTIIRGIAEQYSPKEVTMYVIDFNSMILKNFEKMVHVGGVVTSSEDEALKNLFKLLLAEIVSRKEKLMTAGVSSFNSYREAGKTDLPHIVLAIDNLTALRELYLQDNDVLQEICKDGPAVGIAVVAANAQTTGLGYRYLSYFPTRIGLFCNDSGEYSTLFEHCRTAPDNLPGRCLIAYDNRHLECQVYQSFEGEKEFQRVEKMRSFVEQINKQYVSVVATAIPVVPKILTEELAYSVIKTPLQPYQIIAGLDYATVEPVIMDISQLGLFAISGRKKMGKGNFIRYILSSLEKNRHNAPVQVSIIDSFERKLSNLQNLEIVTDYSLAPEKALEVISQWNTELQNRYESLVSGNVDAIQKAPLLLLIIQNRDVAERISADRSVLAQYKNFFTRFKALKVSVIYSDFENAAIQYGAPEAIKALRENRNFMFFDDLVKLKIVDVSTSTLRQYRKQLETGDCFYLTENGIMKMKSVLSESSLTPAK